MALTTPCAITKQFGSTMPSSPQILAAHTRTEDTELHFLLGFAGKTGDFKHLTNNVVPDLFSDRDGPHSIRGDKPGEDGHRIFLYA